MVYIVIHCILVSFSFKKKKNITYQLGTIDQGTNRWTFFLRLTSPWIWISWGKAMCRKVGKEMYGWYMVIWLLYG